MFVSNGCVSISISSLKNELNPCQVFVCITYHQIIFHGLHPTLRHVSKQCNWFDSRLFIKMCLGMSWNAAEPLYRHPNIIQCLYFTPFLKSPRSPSVNESWLILPSSARRTYAIYNAPVHQETLYIIHLYCVSPFSIIHLQMHTFSNILHSPLHVPSINRVPLILKSLPHHRSISR